MPFYRPSLKNLIDRAVGEFDARLPGADARLAASNLNVLSHVIAAATHGLYGFIHWISRQVFPDSAESENLDRWASIWGISRKPAASAEGEIRVTGAAGSVIPAGTLFSRADGQKYRTTSGTTLVSENASIPAAAAMPGRAGNAAGGTALSAVSPVPGVDSSALAWSSGFSGGADLELDESLRDRLLTRIQQPPHGGAAHDYLAWAKEVPGVTRAWVYPQEQGLGTVTLRFVRDNDGSGAAILPDSAEIAAVQQWIDARRPVGVQLYVAAPLAAPVNIVFSQLTPDTPDVRAAVTAELDDLFLREAAPGCTLLLSHLRAAISAAVAEQDFVLAQPSGNLTFSSGQMPLRGTITWPV